MTTAPKSNGRAMSAHVLNALWSLRNALKHLSFIGAIAILLLAGVSWINLVETPASQREIAALQAQIDSQKQASRALPARRAVPSPTDALLPQLEPRTRFDTVLQELSNGFEAANVALNETQIMEPTLSELPSIGKIELALSARGSYAALKLAIATLLDRHPGLGLQQLVLEKSELPGGFVDAKARFVYLYRK